MKIVAGKQVGPIYYMVDDVAILRTIMTHQLIKTSNKPERGYSNDRKLHYYVSFMRDLTKASRNPNKWTYGIQLDGDKLSDMYKISPYSFAGNAVNLKSSALRVAYISEYDDGTYLLQLVDRPSFYIPKNVYEEIKSAIVNDIEGFNDKKHLTISTGKRSYRGKTVVEKYWYKVPSGGLHISKYTLTDETLTYLLNHTILNESEERIWILDANTQYINISGCITQYIEPEGDNSIEQAIDAGYLPSKRILHY